jgi:GAF domain-containing protein/nitrogen-specific signal transduction histidine kinase
MALASRGWNMASTQGDTLAELQRANAALRRELSERDAALAQRDSDYDERLAHQAATVDVLKAMSASPGDPQPVFDLIAVRARDICGAYGVTVTEFDGTRIHWRAATGVSDDPAVRAAYEARFPMVPSRGWVLGRAVLDRRIIRIDDLESESGLDPTVRGITAKSNVTIPIMRGDTVIGAVAIGSREKGGFSDSQIELLKTFAEQAAIAITSAETYRALQKRTEELAERNTAFAERIDHQAATIDVLKAMSASPGDPQPVFDLIVQQVTTLLDTPTAMLFEYDGALVHFRADAGTANLLGQDVLDELLRSYPMAPHRGTVGFRAILDAEVVHVRDLATDPVRPMELRALPYRSQISVPLLRDGRPIGVLSSGSPRLDAFSDAQIALLKTFAEQAVIAITSAETYRALQVRTADLQESLEYQTATSDVLKAISRSTFDLQPVLDTLVATAARLCHADMALIYRREGDVYRLAANRGFPIAYEEFARQLSLSPGRASVTQRAALECRISHVADITADPEYDLPEASRVGGARTALGVPLLREGEPIGVFTLARQRVEPFTERQIELVRTFADQAVIAMENARLLSEQQEALEQQTATAEVLQVINASPGNLVPVFDAILEKAHYLCGADFGGLFTYDGESAHLHADRNLPLAWMEWLRARSRVEPSNPIYRLVQGDPLFQVEDLREVAEATNDPRARAAVELGGVRTLLLIPLRKDSVLLGIITAYRQEVRLFSAAQIALLENFAAQAVIAMENARLLTEQREALEQQTAVAEVLRAINANPGDLAPVFATILDKAHAVCGATVGSVLEYDGSTVRALATRGFPDDFSEMVTKGYAPIPVMRRLIDGDRMWHVADVTETPPSGTTQTREGRTVRDIGVRTCLLLPLRTETAVVGFISAYRTEVRPFSDREIALLENFAAQAVIAMENARLLTEQREALERQTAMAEVLVAINASQGDLGPVFDAILEKAVRLCRSAFGTLSTFDGHLSHLAAGYGLTPEMMDLLRDPRTPVKGAPTGRILDGEPFVHVVDTTDQDVYRASDGPTVAFIDQIGARTALFVGLRHDSTLLGYVVLFRREVLPFSDKEIALVMNFAAQAVIAMENARLLTEQREALERQTATAEVLQAINANPGNLSPVFDAMLEKAALLCGAECSSFFMIDGDTVQAVATRGLPAGYHAELTRKGAIGPLSGVERVAGGEDVVHLPDMRLGGSYLAGEPFTVRTVDVFGLRTWLGVPLRKDGAALGLLAVARFEVRPFTDRQIDLLKSFAAQAVIAMENARLINETREALEQQTATAEVLQVINRSPGDLTPVFEAILDKAHSLCGAEHGSLQLFDGTMARAVAWRGLPEAFVARIREGYPATGNTALQPLLDGAPFSQIDLALVDQPTAQRAVEIAGMRTFLAVPLRQNDVFLGHIAASRREVRPFSEKEIALLENFAAQAVIAMENARLLGELREALERQTATAEVLGVINASPGELAPVFDAMLERALRLCGAAFGILYTFDGEEFHMEAARGVPAAFEAYRRQHPMRNNPNVPPGQAILTRRAVQVEDVMTHPFFVANPELQDIQIRLGGIRAVLNLPLVKDGTPCGMFVIYRAEPGAFPDKQIALLEDFGAQAVIAMDNARLLNEIRQRQNELDITFENMGDGVAMFDANQQLVAWNRNFQDILDLPDDAVRIGLPFADYIRGLADQGEYGPDANAEDQVTRLTAGLGHANRFERTRPNGHVIDIRQNPIPAGGFVVIYADITERKRAEEALRAARDAAETALGDLRIAQASLIQAEKMASLGQLTAGIAHEIKNPLNFVNNFSDLSIDLLEELNDAVALRHQAEIDELSATLKGNLQKIAAHGRRADGIVRSMLEHSRGSSGERRSVELNTLVEEALSLAYHGARAQNQDFNITMQRDFAEGMAPIDLMPQDMTRVLLNLIGNGFYAATKQAQNGADAGFVPTLDVATRDLGEVVEIRVRDNGAGIPDDIRDKLFQPFFTTKPTGEGTGLGLSISYDIVTQQHGGSITVESEVGEYSEFTIRLPRMR